MYLRVVRQNYPHHPRAADFAYVSVVGRSNMVVMREPRRFGPEGSN